MHSCTRKHLRPSHVPKLLEAQLESWFPPIPRRELHFSNFTSPHWMRAVEFLSTVHSDIEEDNRCSGNNNTSSLGMGNRMTHKQRSESVAAATQLSTSPPLPVLVLLANRCYFPQEGAEGWQASLRLFRLISREFSNETTFALHRDDAATNCETDAGNRSTITGGSVLPPLWSAVMRNVLRSGLYTPNALAHLMRNMTLSKGCHWVQTLSLYTAALLETHTALGDENNGIRGAPPSTNRSAQITGRDRHGGSNAADGQLPPILSNAALARPMRKLTLTALLDAQQWEHALTFFHHTLLHRDLPHFVTSGYLVDLLGRNGRFHELEMMLSLLVPLVGHNRVVVPTKGVPVHSHATSTAFISESSGSSSSVIDLKRDPSQRGALEARNAWTKCFCLALGHLSKAPSPNATSTFSSWLSRIVEVVPGFEPDVFVRAAMHRLGLYSVTANAPPGGEKEAELSRTPMTDDEGGTQYTATQEIRQTRVDLHGSRSVDTALATVRVLAMERDWLRAFLLFADVKNKATRGAPAADRDEDVQLTNGVVQQLAACRSWIVRALPNDAHMPVLELRRRLTASVVPPSADAAVFAQEKEATLVKLAHQQRCGGTKESFRGKNDAAKLLWVDALELLLEEPPSIRDAAADSSDVQSAPDDAIVGIPFPKLVKSSVTPSAVAAFVKIPAVPWSVALEVFLQFRGALWKDHCSGVEHSRMDGPSRPPRGSSLATAAPVLPLVLTLCHLCEGLIAQQKREMALRVASYLLRRAEGSPSAEMLAQLPEIQHLLMEHGHRVSSTVLAYAVTWRPAQHRGALRANGGAEFEVRSADTIASWQDAVVMVQHCATRMVHTAPRGANAGSGSGSASASLPIAAMVALLRRLGGQTVALEGNHHAKVAVRRHGKRVGGPPEVERRSHWEAVLPPSHRWHFALQFMDWVLHLESQSVQRANHDSDGQYRGAQILASLALECALLALRGAASSPQPSPSSSEDDFDNTHLRAVRHLQAAVHILHSVFIRHRLCPPVFSIPSSLLEELLPLVDVARNRDIADFLEAACRTECVAIACSAIIRSVASLQTANNSGSGSSSAHVGALAIAIRFLSFAQRRRDDMFSRAGFESVRQSLYEWTPHHQQQEGLLDANRGRLRVGLEPLWCLSFKALSLAASPPSGTLQTTALNDAPLSSRSLLPCDFRSIRPRVIGHFLMGLPADADGPDKEEKRRNTEVASRVLYWMEKSYTSNSGWARDALRDDVIAALLRSTTWRILAPVLMRHRKSSFLAELQKVEGAVSVEKFLNENNE